MANVSSQGQHRSVEMASIRAADLLSVAIGKHGRNEGGSGGPDNKNSQWQREIGCFREPVCCQGYNYRNRDREYSTARYHAGGNAS